MSLTTGVRQPSRSDWRGEREIGCSKNPTSVFVIEPTDGQLEMTDSYDHILPVNGQEAGVSRRREDGKPFQQS